MWQTPLKGSTFVNLVLDGRDLIATTKGEVFCLDPLSGRICWNNPMRGFGWGLATVATTAPSAVSAMAKHLYEQEQAQAAAASAAAAT